MQDNLFLKKGFTLIELLVVVGIIGLLASIVLTSTNTAREKAKISRARAELRQITQAIVVAQGERGRPLISFAPNANCGQCYCADLASAACINNWTTALAQIQTATGGVFTDLSKFARDPWGNPYFIDANQGETGVGSCAWVDGLGVYGQTIPNLPSVPPSPVCP